MFVLLFENFHFWCPCNLMMGHNNLYYPLNTVSVFFIIDTFLMMFYVIWAYSTISKHYCSFLLMFQPLWFHQIFAFIRIMWEYPLLILLFLFVGPLINKNARRTQCDFIKILKNHKGRMPCTFVKHFPNFDKIRKG